ncbi:MAG: ATP-binding protein, partial [Candidatus Obscuribacter sp.]|nr:ATP-binding protein [Candidatus Obscuribacter sp.]
MFAAPGFGNWLSGAPLDINEMLYTDSGKPRIAIFSINHLNDAQRMFFVTLLANQHLLDAHQIRHQEPRYVFIWTRYLDIFLLCNNPPSETPLLTLLKQARAFGLGLVLATQNPV